MRHGFSLVELSIVLVILGLLTGGIMAGQSLIRGAQMRAVSTEHSRYNAAAQAFRDKYIHWPGDMTNATAFWGRLNGNADCVTTSAAAVNAAGACDGDGNRMSAWAAAPSQSAEFTQFWRHLALAGLIEGTYSGLAGGGGTQHCAVGVACPSSRVTNAGWGVWPAPNYGGNSAFYAIDYGNALMFGGGSSGNIPVNAILNPLEAWGIDSKMDDGKPASGNVIAGNWSTCSIVNSGVASATNFDTRYEQTSDVVGCVLVFRKLF